MLFVPKTAVTSVVSGVLFVGEAGFFDNYVTFALLFRGFIKPSRQRLVGGLALLTCVPYAVMLFVSGAI